MPCPIAIIGIGCRFPGAAGPRAFWKLLNSDTNAITRLPTERLALGWKLNGQPAPWGAFLENIDRFDADFFGISPQEARGMDPQQRLLMEVAWEALEDAAIIPRSLAGSSTGVFMGIAGHNYGSLIQALPDAIDRFSNTGTGGSVNANRIAYFLDLQGPGFAVDGACASSLLAVHMACQSIWSNESSVALAGGVNLTLISGPTLGLTRSGALSPDGVCRVFDAAANGSVRGEGAAVVVLKPLAQAQADGDPIYAVIHGGAVNQNGRSNGLGAPSRRAQEALLRQAYRSAGIAPDRVQHLETQSTANLIGDATELAAAGAVFHTGRAGGEVCRVGSVKPHIGHLEPAAGIAGLIKTALMLKHRQFAPTLNFQNPNPHVAMDRLSLQMQTTAERWPGNAGQRVAGVSAAGYGGVNVHIVLGDAPDADAPDAEAPGDPPITPYLLTLSAKTHVGVKQSAAHFADWLESEGEQRKGSGAIESDNALAEICHTANRGRTRFSARMAIIANDRQELVDRLRAFVGANPEAFCFDNSPEPRQSPAIEVGAAGECDSLMRQARAFISGKELDAPSASPKARKIHGVPGITFQRASYWLPILATDENSAPPVEDSTSGDAIQCKSPAKSDAPNSPAQQDRDPALNTIERRTLHLFEQVLNTSPIRSDDNFFDLGGHSAQALELFSLIEKTFGRAIPLINFYGAPTPVGVAKIIASDDVASHWRPIITLNGAGKRAALFFVPGLGGHAFAMRTFAERLGPDQPISVLHPQGLDPSAVALTSIEEMARVFLTYVRSMQPRGPYHLGGYSFGGSVAFEMACQLQAQGESVKSLTLLDAYAPGAFRKRSLPHRLVKHATMIYGDSQRKKYIKQRVARLWDRIRAAAAGEQQTAAGHKTTGAIVDAVRRVTFANKQAWRNYRPGRFEGRVWLFRATDTDPMISQFADCDPHNGWDPHVDDVDLLVLPCRHLKLFEGANLGLMTEKIAAILQPWTGSVLSLSTPEKNNLRTGA